MSVKKQFSIAILDSTKIEDTNKIIAKYAEITMQHSSHLLFDMQPVNPDEINSDLTRFRIEGEDEAAIDEKLNHIINELDQINEDYSIRDDDAGKMAKYVELTGSLDVKFDNVKIIKDGTYKKIDELKLLKTEFGFCKGYKPDFRPLEGQPIGNVDIRPENLYLFAHSSEDLSKLKELLTEKIMEIDSNLELEFRPFT